MLIDFSSQKNLCAMFFEQANDRMDRPFLWRKINGTYVPTSWNDAVDQVVNIELTPSDLLSEIKRKPTASRAHINDLTADPVASPLYEVVTELRRENQTLKERVHQLELQVNQLRMFKDHVRTNSQ